MNTDTRLMNFRIPPILGSNFSKVCKINNTTMTSLIIAFMEAYTVDMSDQISDKFHKYQTVDKTLSNVLESLKSDSGVDTPPHWMKPLDTFRGLVKDPISGRWMDEQEWRKNR